MTPEESAHELVGSWGEQIAARIRAFVALEQERPCEVCGCDHRVRRGQNATPETGP